MRLPVDPNLPIISADATQYDKSLSQRLVTVFRLFANQLNQLSEGGITARHASQTAAPSTGTWKQGDIIWNSAPASAGYIGWVCTVSGTPGTWKGWGVIA